MTSAVTVRTYIEGDEHGINSLCNRVFGEERSLAEWRRRFVTNPALQDIRTPQTTIVVEKDGAIVGHYGSLLLNMTCADRMVKAIQVVDTVVDPEARIRLRTLRRLFLEHLAKVEQIAVFGFGFPNAAAHTVGKRLFGYQDLTRMRQWFKVLSFKGSIKRRFPQAPSRLLSCVHAAGRMLIRLPDRDTDRYTLGRISRFDEETDRLWECIKSRFGITTARTHSYLNWRYQDQAVAVLSARRGDANVAGFVILKLETDAAGIGVGKILDLLYVELPAAVFLLSSALRYLSDQGADCALYAGLPGDPLEPLLTESGFAPRKRLGPLPAVWLPFGDEPGRSYLADPGNWHLVYGDIDGF